ncbi:MAG: glycosyl hydrolase [Bacteroidota bacterium]|nr:glycosyl hydrolase [Bacteroidota bacterium]
MFSCKMNFLKKIFISVLFSILFIAQIYAQYTPTSFVNRSADFDVFPGFQNPPAGYGEVPFYWWMGDTLTKERLLWQLDRLTGKGISSLQINYAHSDKGGIKWGLSYPSKPALFTEEWWDLFGWFMKEAKKRGMAISLSDYTLGLGQGSYVDEVITTNPDLLGYELFYDSKTAEELSPFFWDIPNSWISLRAFQSKDGKIIPGTSIDLSGNMSGRYLTWDVPKGNWIVTCVYAKKKDFSLDPMNPNSGKVYIEKFFKRFEDRFPGELGKGLNFFFSDELDFNLYGILWNKYFEKEFEKRKGYSILPELAALFTDIGPRTVKIRLDYNDVMVALSEEGFFKPIYDWQQERGMIHGCDHGGRGKDLTEFGDYFRTQKWNQGPGCDQPMLQEDIVKNKVASSIAHLYERPRTWLEGFHSSGWSTSSADLSKAIFANFMMGQNLLSLHGLYYSTHGGWWEWAPPCNHFRMPYYEHINPLMNATERLSYLLSQGYHQCDVAILYPVASMAAKLDGETSAKTAFDAGTNLYNRGIDFDFIDDESVARAEVVKDELHVSGEKYKILIIPSMKAIRFSTIKKALEFFRSGGIVINIGSLPLASERIGSNDSKLNSMTKEIFGKSADDTTTLGKIVVSKNNGKGFCSNEIKKIEAFINSSFVRDFQVIPDSADKIIPRIMHRKIGHRDIYSVYNVPAGIECFFRAKGNIEIWDPFSGKNRPLKISKQDNQGTFIKLPLEKTEVNLIVFNPEEINSPVNTNKSTLTSLNESSETLSIDGNWEFEVKPVLDNKWGDFHWPPTEELIGPEIRRTTYSDETGDSKDWMKKDFNDSKWQKVTNGYGPAFYKIGPLPENIDVKKISKILLQDRSKSDSILLDGKYYKWEPYSFSYRYGVENDPGHQGWHGLKEQMYDEFIRLGKPDVQWTSISYRREDAGTNYFLYTNVFAPEPGNYELLTGEIKPSSIWLNSVELTTNQKVNLKKGNNSLLIHFDQPCTSYVVIKKEGNYLNKTLTSEGSLAMRWYGDQSILKFNTRPNDKNPAGWYRFHSAPGLKKMDFAAYGKVKLWINEQEYETKKGSVRPDGSYNYSVELGKPIPQEALVAIRIEQQPGVYAGAALPEPIKMQCEKGIYRLGDWSLSDGLHCYSGGAWYRRNLKLTPEQKNDEVVLDLGHVVSSAEVIINGQNAGIRLAPPYCFDISRFVREGDNKLEVLIYNTAANHYSTIPTRYIGSLESGLIGPVKLRFSEKLNED